MSSVGRPTADSSLRSETLPLVAVVSRLNVFRFFRIVPDSMSFDSTDSRIDEAIQLFNEGEFFACHDVFEDFWSELMGSEKTFFQGMIHAAVCLHHFEESNLTGARKMYGSFVRYVSNFAPEFCGIQVQQLMDDMETCFADLLAVSSGYPHGIELKRELLPRISRRIASK